MKKEQFKSLLKQIIKEVISETEDASPEDIENDAPVDRTGSKMATSKTDKRWRGKMRMGDKLRAGAADLPPEKRTPFFRGPSADNSKYDDVKEVEDVSPEDVENDAPVDRTGTRMATAKSDKRWRGKVRTLDKLRAGAADLPPEKRTPFFKGPSGSNKYGDQ